MNEVLKMNDPFMNEQGVPDLAKFKELFGFQNVGLELSQLIGISESSVKQTNAIRLLNNDKFNDIKYIASVLYSRFKSIDKCRQWLYSAREEWFGDSPMDMIKAGRASGVARYLKQATHPEGLTFGG